MAQPQVGWAHPICERPPPRLQVTRQYVSEWSTGAGEARETGDVPGNFRDRRTNANPTGRFLTIRQAADVAGIGARTMYERIRRGQVPAIKIGSRGIWRVEASRLTTALAVDHPPQDQASTQTRQRAKPEVTGHDGAA